MRMFLALRPLKVGIILTLLAFLFGFGLGGAFGAAEDSIKGKLRRDGEAALETVYGGDEAKMDKVVSKSWSYLKRAHMHGGGMAAAALALILLVATLPGSESPRKLTALLLGGGSLGYPMFWLLAGPGPRQHRGGEGEPLLVGAALRGRLPPRHGDDPGALHPGRLRP